MATKHIKYDVLDFYSGTWGLFVLAWIEEGGSPAWLGTVLLLGGNPDLLLFSDLIYIY